MRYKVLIIDDESDATESLEFVLRDLAEMIEIVGVSNSADNGLEQILEKKPDIVLLDIEMPGMNGFELLARIDDPQFEVIFITAFNQYAIEAFRTNAVDYLLKPVSTLDCEGALNRAILRIKGKIINNVDFKQFLSDVVGVYSHKITISSKDGIEYIKTSDILYIEADESYSFVQTINNRFVSSKHLSSFKKQLFNDSFQQVHQSYLINLEHVQRYNKRENYILMSNGNKVNVSRRNRLEFIEAMKKFNYGSDNL